jgi:hypothetical protein
VYPDLKDAVVDFMDNNIGDFSVDTVHAYLNRCINIIIEHDDLFFVSSSDDASNDENDNNNLMVREQQNKTRNSAEIHRHFKEAAEDFFADSKATSKAKVKKEKQMLLKGITKSVGSSNDSALDDQHNLCGGHQSQSLCRTTEDHIRN